jgi:hypothetical protein
MVEIKPEHMRAFETAQLARFIDRAVAHARRTFPVESERFSDDQLRDRFRRQMPVSQAYGLRSERQLLCFFDTGLLLGDNFDHDPAIPEPRAILMDRSKSADERAITLLSGAIRSKHEVAS